MGMVGTMETSSCHHSVDVVILGAGYAGLMAAMRLSRRKWRLRVAVVGASDQFLERVRLQESIVAAVAHTIASIAEFLAGTTIDFICGSVVSLDADQRLVRIATGSHEREITFDQAIYALGSNIDVEQVAGVSRSTLIGSRPATARIPRPRCGKGCRKMPAGRSTSSR